jgi:sialate O-acetylesterase
MKARCIVVMLLTSFAARADVKLPGLICDHMVIQQGMPVRIWGRADPGEEIEVALNNRSGSAQAATDGTWEVRLEAMSAGGPFTMTVAGKNTLRVEDVLVGEVWLCSGQSNMEWPLKHARDGKREVAAANARRIRLFRVPHVNVDRPRVEVNGAWKPCTPETAQSFSAVGYFFGRHLARELNVPIGLIQSAVGGTCAESWTRRKTVLAMKDLAIVQMAKRCRRDPAGAKAEYEQKYAEWNRLARVRDTGNRGYGSGFARGDLDDSDWRTMDLPRPWEEVEGMYIDGAVWFRRAVDIPAEWAGKDLALQLGPIDDVDVTYFNNIQVGATGQDVRQYWLHPRSYTVPAQLVRTGRNIIAVRVFDFWLSGGFMGEPGEMTLGPGGRVKPMALAGDWKCKVERGVGPRTLPPDPIPPVSPDSVFFGGLFNGMIHPLTRLPVRGVIWYQGESNASRPGDYQELLNGMIRDWRRHWGREDMPFLIVQLPNFHARNATPEESSWAEIREVQRLTAETIPHIGLAVTIDLGEAGDIHPKNKQDVGKRLALVARGMVYGQSIIWSGPAFDSMTIEDDRIRLRFRKTASGLNTPEGKALAGFAVAGADGRFVWADARIEGDTVVVRSDRVSHPVDVRYGWAFNPRCTLYNSAGLPASPFRTGR